MMSPEHELTTGSASRLSLNYFDAQNAFEVSFRLKVSTGYCIPTSVDKGWSLSM